MVISLYPDKKLENKLKDLADKENRSMNNLILRIIREHIFSSENKDKTK